MRRALIGGGALVVVGSLNQFLLSFPRQLGFDSAIKEHRQVNE